MTLSQILLIGFLAGITIGAPYGPSGILSLYRSIQYGRIIGGITALGSLLAIFLFSFLAAIFIEYITPMIQDNNTIQTIRLIMGVILFVIGLVLTYFNFISKPKTENIQKEEESNYFKIFISAFGIGIVSGKNLIGFPTFLMATPYISESPIPVLFKALIFSLGSLLSSSILYFLLVMISEKYGTIVFARIMPLLKHFLALFFLGLGIYLIIQYF